MPPPPPAGDPPGDPQPDNPAFDAVVEQFKDRVFNTALSFLRNAQDAEDIAQEVFIEVWRSKGRFEGRSALGTWIYRIAVHKCLDLIKSRRRRKRFGFIVSIFGQDDKLRYDPPDFNHPGVEAENRERTKILFEAIDKLAGTQRVAYTLCELEGLSYQEIAEIMGKSVPSVESLILRARRELRRLLHDYYRAGI